jgi:hypothetical protein
MSVALSSRGPLLASAGARLLIDAPMRPRCGQDLDGGERLRRDVKAAALAGLPALFADRPPSAKAVKCGNASRSAKPGGVVHGAGAAVYPSMVGIDRFGRVGRRDRPIVEQASSYIANHPSSLAGARAPAPPSAASGGANRHERVRNLLFGGSGRQRCDSAIRLVEAPVTFGTAAQGADHFSTYAWPDEVC